ncbi:MAG: TIM barrel protein [Planctomycetota bacterium]|nr:TIM barrel protein [Planctomycetota bacterium]
MKPFRVGIDNYCLIALELSPLEELEWARAHGADGVQFSGLHAPGDRSADEGFLSELAGAAAHHELYLEWGGGQHIPFDTSSWVECDLRPINERAARQARTLGTSVIRSCSGGLMRWSDEAPPTEVLLRAMAAALREQMPMLADYGVTLAIETHFEFTTFELLRVFEMCDAEPGGPLGICLDMMNLLTMLEEPVAATDRILPWIVSTHTKDGGLLFDERGLVSFPTEAGKGQIDFAGILARLSTLERVPNLSIEDHGGSFDIPIFSPAFLSRFPDLSAQELARLACMACANGARPPGERLNPLQRAAWPRQCEARVQNGIRNMKALVADRSELRPTSRSSGV